MKPPVAYIQQRQHHIVEVNQYSDALLDQLLGAGLAQPLVAELEVEHPLRAEPDQPLMLSNVPTLGQISLPP